MSLHWWWSEQPCSVSTLLKDLLRYFWLSIYSSPIEIFFVKGGRDGAPGHPWLTLWFQMNRSSRIQFRLLSRIISDFIRQKFVPFDRMSYWWQDIGDKLIHFQLIRNKQRWLCLFLLVLLSSWLSSRCQKEYPQSDRVDWIRNSLTTVMCSQL
jgi:hypothetical protein